MSDVPYDILQEILSRLPVTSLLRFRCVAKSWKVLIDSPLLINHHLNLSRRISNSSFNTYIIFKRGYVMYHGDDLGWGEPVEINSSDAGFLYSEDIRSLTKQDPANFSKINPESEILGSCDGLLVLSKGEDDIMLWNPSIRRFKIIPAPGIQFPLHLPFYIVYGFGYDSLSDDYKLVRIVQDYQLSHPEPTTSQVKVYSVKRNSWKQIADFPYYLKVRWGNGEFVNGALHWIVGTTCVMKGWHDNDDCLIGSFDLQTEDYRLVPIPEFANDDDIRITNLGALRGCLTAVCDHNESHDAFHFWVMREYGVKESWSHLFTLSKGLFGFWCYSDVYMPIVCSDCGRKVLVGSTSGILLWYDLDRKSSNIQAVKNLFDDRYYRHFKYLEVHTCLKSLVLINNSVSDGDFDMVSKTEEEKYGKYESPTLRFDFLRTWFECDDI